MITLQDLNAAIAECQGERNPNANTCIKLAAFYTIRQEMFGGNSGGGEAKPEAAPVLPWYSTQAAPVPAPEQAETTIDFDSGSEFSRAIDGRDAYSMFTLYSHIFARRVL